MILIIYNYFLIKNMKYNFILVLVSLFSIVHSADMEFCKVNNDCPNASGNGNKCGLMVGHAGGQSGSVLTCIDEWACG